MGIAPVEMGIVSVEQGIVPVELGDRRIQWRKGRLVVYVCVCVCCMLLHVELCINQEVEPVAETCTGILAGSTACWA